MTFAFEFHPEAEAELVADVDRYDDRELGLGNLFAEAVRSAIGAATEDPDAWPVWPGWDREPVVRSKRSVTFPTASSTSSGTTP